MSRRTFSDFALFCLLFAFSALAMAGDEPKKESGDFPMFVRVNGCEVTKKDKEIILTGPNGDRAQILACKECKPPFALHIEAKTDSKNIRLYYAAGMLIFNWESNEEELRIHDPETNEQTGVANQGKVEPDSYHKFVWEIYPNGMRVLVDGKERTRKLGNYEKLEANPGIGPAFGSIITMKSFRVEELKGKLPE